MPKASELLLFYKLHSSTALSIIELGTNNLSLEITYAVDMVLLCKDKGHSWESPLHNGKKGGGGEFSSFLKRMGEVGSDFFHIKDKGT